MKDAAISLNGSKVFITSGLKAILKKLLDEKFRNSAKFILVDKNTSIHCLPHLLSSCKSLRNAHVISIRSGEESKTIQTAITIWQQLCEAHADRHSLLINLGGGMITDLGSFCASTYMRGVAFINIPTTLMAMTDAAIGGKTAIDFTGIKNLVGTFANPEAVVIYTKWLQTLDQRQINSGNAEMIKHALVADKKWWEQLRGEPFNNLVSEKNLHKSIAIKCNIVKKDPYEKGLRKVLNFGHTLGHSVEAWSMANDSNPLLHGECVAIGMVMETFLSHLKSSLSKNHSIAIAEYIDSCYRLPKFNKKTIAAINAYMYHDKKNSGGKINFTLLAAPGKAVINQYCDEQTVQKAFDFYNSIAEKV